MTKTNSIIEAKNIIRTYGQKDDICKALDGVSFTINKGESVAIIGKSGSGKSTLMHILACLDKPTSGELLINGTDVSKMSEKQQEILRGESFGFVFQQFFLNPNDTVLENVILPLKINGQDNRKIREEKGIKILEEVDLLNKKNNKAKNLSGGQKQRVCIARALVGNPQIVFADEPTGNLDSTNGETIEKILFGLNKKGITLILVTHDQELAQKCQKQIMIKDGKIVNKL
ncbi:MAG: ABC transporter ATP-binding protein [Candidatus Shapirobacteria bacterium]|nr:ABC transporter ATP-binding protein [Candidatus Shapirobacteria bacterium]MDD4382593.1 ABC transporter ATP-binding protein [Candidatus Shapirobacteria bacterium]